MATKYQRAHRDKWSGVYFYQLANRGKGEPDLCYVINYKRQDGRLQWEKIGRKSEGYTPQIAAEIRSERVRAIRHGEEVKTTKEIQRERSEHDRSLAEIATAYFDSRGLTLSGSGLNPDAYRWNKWLAPLLGRRRVSELTSLDVQRVKRAMDGSRSQTIKNTLEVLRRLCNYGARHGLCPALSFKIVLPATNNEVVEYLTPEEATRLVAVLNEWPSQDVARMLKVAMLTGMRRGEIFNLQDSDIDRQHAFITIRNPKGGRTVSIPLSAPVETLLREQAEWRDERHPGSPYLFPGMKGKKRVDCGAVDRIKKAADLPKHFRPFHGLRHHFAVTLANSGAVSLDMIGELLTHKSVAMTKRYGQFLPETKRKASELAARLVMEGSRDQGSNVVALPGGRHGA